MPSSDRVLKAVSFTGQPAPASPGEPALAGGSAAASGSRRVVGSDASIQRQSPPAPVTRESAVRPGAPSTKELSSEIVRAIREAERRGYEAGRARAEAEFVGAIAAAGQMADAFEVAAPHQAPVIAALVAEIAIAVARRILDAEVGLEPALLRGALERAMEGVNGSPEVRVILHPSAVDLVRDAWITHHGTAFAGKRWSFDPDPSLPIGGCVIRHEHGFVDAGLEAQLAEVSAAMDNVVPLIGRGAREVAA